ncbi:4-hydroxy-tetrahydrodipicolinate reductase [Anaerovorax odorimutans]|uniref:4-hydroxy-tetrahydrodipicolinate reductase n=1 Tax=Anaerovorax odorimutans TaxID=109327 RepID=UPI000419F730|nr:4-hydroxy-tetrahydrodipicolinate reductase [Anaerovorax odorimutans]
MIKVILHGCNGKMGKVLQNIIQEDNEMEVIAGFDQNKSNEPVDFKIYTSPNDCDLKSDVIIDFSHYTAIPSLLDYCVNTKTPVVVATTALGDDEKKLLLEAAKTIPVFNSFNMSLGINTISKMLQVAVPIFEENFNTEIIEKHHNKKVDSPSGTALLLADSINKACLVKKDYIFGRHGKNDECKITDLGIHAIRGGSLPGEHTVIFAGPDEVIEIKHTAYSKNIFAVGAVKAAKFLANQKPGLYSMEDLI